MDATKEELEQRVKMLTGRPIPLTCLRTLTRTAAVDNAKRERNQLAARSPRSYSRHAPYPSHAYSPRHRYSGEGGPPFRNRSLVIQQSAPSSDGSDASADNQSGQGWVQMRDRHLQLINKNVYDKMASEGMTCAPN
jgi:hypothetical protein